MDQQQRKRRVALLSVVSNSTLVASKLFIGLTTGSVSVLSEAVHSGVDLLASGIALFAVNTSHRPADEDHPFGHGKVENVSGAIEAILILVAAAWIVREAVLKLIHPQPLEAIGLGVLVMGLSVVMNVIISGMLFRVARETESVALEADAWHLRTDVWTSLGVMAGLALIWALERLLPNVSLHWIDPVTAIAVAALIVRAGWKLTIDASRDLLDQSLPVTEREWMGDHLRQSRPQVMGIHHLRTRRSGPARFVEFHLLVDPALSVEAAHQITDEITDEINRRYPGTTVTIHVEPCNGFCSGNCRSGCFLSAPERRIVRQARERSEGGSTPA